MKASTKARILDWSGLGLTVAAPLVATATQFPVLVEQGSGQTISGVFLFVAILCSIPAIIFLKRQADSGSKVNVPYALIGSNALVFALIMLQDMLPQFIIIATSWAGATDVAKVMTLVGHHLERKEVKQAQTQQQEVNNAVLAKLAEEKQ